MRALLITAEKRWSDALRSLLTTSCDLVVLGAGALDHNACIFPAIDVCFVAGAEVGSDTLATIGVIRTMAPAVPLFVFCDRAGPQWHEDAVIAGAHQIFEYPLRPRLVKIALERALEKPPTPASRSPFI